MDKIVNALIIGGIFERLSSHWCYETKHFRICDRIFTDDEKFEEKFQQILSNVDFSTICFSGKDAVINAKRIDSLVQLKCNDALKNKYYNIIKAVRIQNTNIPKDLKYVDISDIDKELGEKSSGLLWLHVALDYKFDVIFVQTYGNADIINALNRNNNAVYLPFAYNDRRFYPRTQKKNVDIGMYFKIERHSNRLRFIDEIIRLVYKNGWKICLSNAYWGEDYAHYMGEAKIILHYSYVGDIPYRLYEAAGSKACFLTDPLGYGIENFFDKNEHYFEYKRDLSDLEYKINWILEHQDIREKVEEEAYKKAVNNFTWEKVAETIVVPTLMRTQHRKVKNI